jgi:hypothetical protein
MFFDYKIHDAGENIQMARVYALDHPRLGTQTVRTSKIVATFDDGSFETLNTIYKPIR